MPQAQATTNPRLSALNQPTPARDWTIATLLDNYPWVAEDFRQGVQQQLDTAEISGQQQRVLMGEAARVNERYRRMAATLERERLASILDVILRETKLYNPGPPDLGERFMADAEAMASGITLQHWQVAMCEWLDSMPQPDDRGIATCRVEPDEHTNVPFMIEMQSATTAGTDGQHVELHAYEMDTGQIVGSAIWVMPEPNQS